MAFYLSLHTLKHQATDETCNRSAGLMNRQDTSAFHGCERALKDRKAQLAVVPANQRRYLKGPAAILLESYPAITHKLEVWRFGLHSSCIAPSGQAIFICLGCKWTPVDR